MTEHTQRGLVCVCVFSRPNFQKILPTLQNFDETKSRFHNQLIGARNWFDSKNFLVSALALLQAAAWKAAYCVGGRGSQAVTHSVAPKRSFSLKWVTNGPLDLATSIDRPDDLECFRFLDETGNLWLVHQNGLQEVSSKPKTDDQLVSID